MSMRFSRTTGPQCVCDAVSINSSRLMPYFFSTSARRRRPRRARDADQVGGDEHEPLAGRVLEAEGLGVRSWSFPSAGLVRDAYPAIHIDFSGVMTFVATPALYGRIGGREIRNRQATREYDERRSRYRLHFSSPFPSALSSFRIALSRIASESGPASATVGS